MLPPIIIDHIKRREHDERLRQHRPQLELPVPPPPRRPVKSPAAEDDDSDRGVVVIDVL